MSPRHEISSSPVGVLRLPSYDLAVSAYDRAASLLIALLVLVGVLVTGLLIIYLTSRIFARPRAVPVTLASFAGTAGDALPGMGNLDGPGLEEVFGASASDTSRQLGFLPEVVSETAPELDDLVPDPGDSGSPGLGGHDGRRDGSGGVVQRSTRAQRWEIRFEGEQLDGYARQLDFFGIELGVLGADNRVHYASNLSQSTPDRRAGPPELESRMHMAWRKGPLMEADHELLTRAGWSPRGRIILQFYPEETEEALAVEEQRYAGEREVSTIRKTIFGVKQDGRRYRFYVIEQRYWTL